MAIAENIGYDATGKSCAVVIKKSETLKASIRIVNEHLSHDLFDELLTKKFDLQGQELETKKEISK